MGRPYTRRPRQGADENPLPTMTRANPGASPKIEEKRSDADHQDKKREEKKGVIMRLPDFQDETMHLTITPVEIREAVRQTVLNVR